MENNISAFADHCCGCGACAASCPKKAIEMKPNAQGFLFPTLREDLCVNCGLCVKACSFQITDPCTDSPLQTFATKHKDSKTRSASRSGGIFTAVSDWIFRRGGAVYGCMMQDCKTAVHSRATTPEERNAFRGSKYIQSQTGDIYAQVARDLKDGLWVLFTGTPCQIHAVRSFCKNTDTSKLVCMDVVCHGVPSPKVWGDYMDHLEKQASKKIVSVDFRDKQKFGWASHRETVVFQDGSDYSGTDFRKLFYDHYLIREACFACPYKSLHRVGDFSIADCWGITDAYPDFDDNKGVSLVLVNTNLAKSIYAELTEMDTIEVDIQKLMQPCLEKNWPIPSDYSEFWAYYQKHSFQKVLDKYVYHKPEGFQGFKEKLLGIPRAVLNKIRK